MAASGPTIKVKGVDYDINRDFTWRELLTVEELAGVPLARDGALDSMAVLGALVFVVHKREDETLKWEGFLDGSIEADLADEPEPEPDEKPAAKRRPTKPSA